MDPEFILTLIPAVVLFLYGIESFSTEIQRIAGERLRSVLERFTRSPVRGSVLGFAVTALMQSSTATTLITVGLVNAGVISFSSSLGVIFGSNVGSTITAQLIALNLTSMIPILVVVGFLISIAGGKYGALGKPIFYFGLVFFSLNLIAKAVAPFQGDPYILEMFGHLSNIGFAILVGFLVTNIFQSSAVTIGLTLVFAESGFITLDQAIPVFFGANIGTTTTSLFASLRMNVFAKRSAVAHFLFNFLGVIIFLPILPVFSGFVTYVGGTIPQMIANAHFFFNFFTMLIFLAIIVPFKALVERLVPGKEEEIVFASKYISNNHGDPVRMIEKELAYTISVTKSVFEEAMASLSTGKYDKTKIMKLESLADFLDLQISRYILELSKPKITEKKMERLVILTRVSHSVKQLAGLGGDLFTVFYDQQHFRGDGLSDIYVPMRKNMDLLISSFPSIKSEEMRSNDIEMRQLINSRYHSFIKEHGPKDSAVGSFLPKMLSIFEDANAKIREMRKLSELYGK